MSDYTKLNLRDVENMAPKFGLAPDLEARFPRRELGSRSGTLSLQRLAPNARYPFGHKHAGQEEHYVILDGAGRMKLDDEVVEVRRWDAIRVAAETMRAFEAGPEGLEVLVFGAPIGEANDAEVIEGWWDKS